MHEPWNACAWKPKRVYWLKILPNINQSSLKDVQLEARSVDISKVKG